MIESSKEEPSFISKFGLDDWKFALPVGLFLGIPALANEVLLLFPYIYNNLL